ncbi:MAG: hypothetical protein QOH65_670 [Methylobacteriaceae bacterium]|jgi:hypothetical protein|nr:hypothetical protein [Methylobacteriaceae bacterium]
MLTQLQIQNGRPKEKPYTLSDGRGLHLYVHSSGSKLWRIRFRFTGKANMLSLGSFPEVSLADARKKRDTIRQQIADGIDPAVQRKTEKARSIEAKENTFGKLAVRTVRPPALAAIQ